MIKILSLFYLKTGAKAADGLRGAAGVGLFV